MGVVCGIDDSFMNDVSWARARLPDVAVADDDEGNFLPSGIPSEGILARPTMLHNKGHHSQIADQIPKAG